MSDLLAFLNARLAEDEEGAQGVLDSVYAGNTTVAEWQVRTIKAQRAIMAALEVAARDLPPAGSMHDDPYEPAVSYGHGERDGLLLAAKHLATIWSDHRDYDPEWAPTL